MIKHIAAIDVGTNSFHMIIALVDTTTGNIAIVDKEREMIRIGIGLERMKHISEETMSKAAFVLSRFKRICESKNAEIRAVGTSAVREAENSEQFIKRMKIKTGIDIEVVSGIEEARLIYKGVINAVPVFDKKILVIDIGGGSTEFIVGSRNRIKYGNSLKMGAVRFTEKYFKHGIYKSMAIRRCRDDIEGMLIPVVRDLKRVCYEEIIGTSGTILNTLNMVKKLRLYNSKNYWENFFTDKEFYSIFRQVISAEKVEKIAEIPGMDKKRADIYLPGILILEGIFRLLNIKKMRVSEYALREGLIFDTIERMRLLPDVTQTFDLRLKSVSDLAKKFCVEEKHAYHTAKLSLEIFDQMKSLHGLGYNEREYLYYSAILHDIGLTLSHSKHHIHSYYLIRNAELIGFTENEKKIIANTARYHRKSHPKLKHPGYFALSNKDRQTVKKLASILRIADGLDRMHSALIRSVKVVREKRVVRFQLKHRTNSQIRLDIWGAETKKFLFEETFGLRVSFELSPKK